MGEMIRVLSLLCPNGCITHPPTEVLGAGKDLPEVFEARELRRLVRRMVCGHCRERGERVKVLVSTEPEQMAAPWAR